MPRHSSRVTRKCEYCGNEFFFNESPSVIRKGAGRFCSKTCHYRGKTGPRVIRACEACGNKFTFNPSPSKRRLGSVGRFCSHKCYWEGKTTPMETRFLECVGPPDDNGCILWTGGKNRNGYGIIYSKIQGKQILAHRAAWELHHGPIPPGLDVLHDCPGGDKPSCVNADHLWLGTQADNVADAVAKGRNKKGENDPNAKLNEAKVHAIRKRYAACGITQEELSRDYGVIRQTIGDVVNRKIWKHI